jgi:hypothetical protein
VTVEDVVAGNERQILRVVWKIALRQLSLEGVELMMDGAALRSRNALDKRIMVYRTQLLGWCQKSLREGGADEELATGLDNFTTCWENGLAFHFLLRSIHPTLKQQLEPQRFANEAQDRTEWPALCDRAFDLAYEHLDVPVLLYGKDLNGASQIDEKSVLLYVGLLASCAKARSVRDEAHSLRRIEEQLDVYRKSLDGRSTL